MPEAKRFRVEGLKGFGSFGLGYQRKVFVGWFRVYGWGIRVGFMRF